MLTDIDPSNPASIRYHRPLAEYDLFAGIEPPTPRALVGELLGFVQDPAPTELIIGLDDVRYDTVRAGPSNGKTIRQFPVEYDWVHHGETVVDLLPVAGEEISLKNRDRFEASFGKVEKFIADQLPRLTGRLVAAQQVAGYDRAGIERTGQRFERSDVLCQGSRLFDVKADAPIPAVIRYVDRFVVPIGVESEDSSGIKAVETLHIERVRINLHHGRRQRDEAAPYKPAG